MDTYDLNSVRESERLSVTQAAFQTNPEPHRAWISLTSMVSYLVQSDSKFAVEGGGMARYFWMRE